MTDYPLSIRSRDQLLSDFDGRTPPAEKMLNLIYSLYEAIASGGSAPEAIVGPGEISAATTSGSRFYVNDGEEVELTLEAGAAIGTSFHFFQLGVGAVTLVADSGESLLAVSGKASATGAQYAVMSAEKVSATEWLVYGALADA